MATPVAAAVEAVAQQVPRRFGNKQVFLPNHVIAFIRPKPKQPPNLATFVVPLQFNKLDLRDYLYHAYNVEVTAVRSFINQPAPKQKHGNAGRYYRPRSQKMMIAELVKPFVWPEPPAKKDREAFDYDMYEKLNKERSKAIDAQVNTLKTPLRPVSPIPKDRQQLKEEAAEVLKTGEWKNRKDANEDDNWTEVEKDIKV
ncbi:hypothetical protein C8A01DRAFT_41102 [Parachaetomium inaequale]|uniref:Large ribosomal subunit protein uL23m n=1 Tax=Parachaetomium inaequale TaxID=2588326 RepID=A0AAN6SMD0_9PEZI|nr:hypothetical protein C8A01DRAFT_41102 [Parachaetomium inaequale]